MCRNKWPKEKFSTTTKTSASKMTDQKTGSVDADSSGDMIFEPILEEGVFRFDCSATDRDEAFPSLSFVHTKYRDTPIKSHAVPLHIPAFKKLLGHQIVKLEVSL